MVFIQKFLKAIKKRFIKNRPSSRRKKKAVKKNPRKKSRPSPKKPLSKKIRKVARPKNKKSAVKRKPLRKSKIISRAKPKPKKESPGSLIGEITHYFPKISVCVVKVTSGRLCVGDVINVRGHTSSFTQPVLSLQIEHLDVQAASKGDLVGLKVIRRTRAGDKVYTLAATKPPH
ncbi:MAG TPA: hypothetical protein PL155_06650 [Candidatus Omnitrophota bacterium]|nr:hypothetical protein [Candidatus Omnitrophota bacterium]HPD83842.1 hypothetical protein [Candidatus Omnitrophota bacterium]HRZ02699.1 hypothetical protein [Candidatus Omnitrophota bacterium]